MSYKELYEVSVEEANRKLANDLLRENLRLEKMIEAAHERLDDQGKLIAELRGTIERIRDWAKTVKKAGDP